MRAERQDAVEDYGVELAVDREQAVAEPSRRHPVRPRKLGGRGREQVGQRVAFDQLDASDIHGGIVQPDVPGIKPGV